ncbi:DoxX family protein [Streptomyces cavernae]|uniref:DoxX family protein n=1 Tax=Streptomyces cavernae TaxID=2259034 RepID=UPI00192E5E6B
MDTRTPRTPTGDRSSGFDDAPALSMVKVPSDPAQVIVNHASFRVQLPTATRAPNARGARRVSTTADTARVPVVGAQAGSRRRAPVVWSGKSAPGDAGATGLLQAVRTAGVRYGDDALGDAGATQVIPRFDQFDNPTVETPTVTGPPHRLLPQQLRSAGSAYEELHESAYQAPYGESYQPSHDSPHGAPYESSQQSPYQPSYGYPYESAYDARYDDQGDQGDEGPQGYESPYGQDEFGYEEQAHRGYDADSAAGGSAAGVRHAYYPGRRMNLGVVLLPLRVFLGCISIYAGMGKLCDPVYFDGGERGSMVKWLNSLHPWTVAEPMREWALQHPVGAGLAIAFAQVIVGVLTVLGLWQRVAAVLGALLSAALLVTVSWKTVPAYDAPDIIYLAAWSPLIIAGAPVYSVDGRLAGKAWRTLGPRAPIWDLRRRVLRHGALVATLVVGLTLLVGSLLGGAVRDADRVTVPGPGEAPRNELPGSPLPLEPGERRRGQSPSASNSPTQGATTASPSGAASTPGAEAPETAGATSAGVPSETQGSTAGQAPPQRSSPVEQAPSTSAGPTSSGGSAVTGGTGSSGGGTSSGGSGGSGGGGNGGGGGGSGSSGGRLVGGLLG